ncbi:hypothetical protein VR010_14935 [Actinomycetaceae bacterium L2_0104]
MTGTITEHVAGAFVAARIDGAEDDVVAPATAGVTYPGARVRMRLDDSGRVSEVAVPDDPPPADTPPVWIGATGEYVEQVAQGQEELAESIIGLGEDIQDSKSKADQAVRDAAEAKTSVDGVNASMTQRAAPETRPNGAALVQGDQWRVLDGNDRVIDSRVWNGTQWVPYKLLLSSLAVPGSVGNILLEDGAVTAPKITASEELSAKVATFLQVTTEMLLAGDARITGTMLANTINLASELIAGDPQGIHTVLDGAGLHVNNGASRLMDLGVTAGPTGVSIRNPKTNAMQSLSGMVFGGEFFTRSDVIEIRSSGTGWTGYVHEYLSPEFVAQSERYAVIFTFHMGNSDVGAQIEAPVDMRWRRGSGGWDDPTDYTRFFVASAYTVPLENRGDLRMSVVSTVPGRTYRLFNAFRARRNDSSAGIYRIASRSALLLPI